MLKISANDAQLTVVACGPITSDRIDLPCEITLSKEFDGLAVTVVFKAGEVQRDVAMLGSSVHVPAECLEQAGEVLMVGIWAGDGSGRPTIPTVWASAGTIRTGALPSGYDPDEPEPDWAAQVQQAAANAVATANSVRADADAGVFDGEDGYSPTAIVEQLADGATITITDKDGTTTATVHDGADGRDGRDGADGLDGYSPTATVTQTAAGATISITDKSVTTTASVSNGTDGTDGTDGVDGFSPTVDVQAITGGHEVTITDADGAHSFEVLDGDPATPGSITDAMLAPDGIKAQVAQLFGNQLNGTMSGTIDTAADAYAAPPMALVVDGASTQAGTPTPDAPVPILSVDGLEVHASADGGTTDYTNWPVGNLLPEGTDLRSLPDGTKDTLHLSYLRPSTRAGWAWYSREVMEAIGRLDDIGTLTWSLVTRGGTDKYQATLSGCRKGSSNQHIEVVCSTLAGAPTRAAIADITDASNTIRLRYDYGILMMPPDTDVSTITGILDYPLATPVTTTLDPIELPELPAPTATVWCDGGSATPTFQMQYVKDTNLVVQQLTADTAIAYASIAAVDGPTATASHAIGTYLTMGGTLYKVTRAIAVGETIAAGTNVTATTVMAELIARTA